MKEEFEEIQVIDFVKKPKKGKKKEDKGKYVLR